MHLIAEARMELLVHKDLPEQQDQPDRKEHKGLQGLMELMERLEHRDQQDRKDLPDQLVQQGHKVLRVQAAD